MLREGELVIKKRKMLDIKETTGMAVVIMY